MIKPFEENVGLSFGAPMGRRSSVSIEGKCHLQQVKFYDGDYDKGGAYWGGGRYTAPLFCAWNNEDAIYIRANNRAAAKQALKEEYPHCSFYR